MVYWILAHGALGWWDEIIFAGVAVIFIGIMGISWVRSRNVQPEFDDEPRPQQTEQSTERQQQTDRFRLD
ncbi:MAG: hypothetical protein ACOCYT_02535 [Chloroflexota bacterium]